MGVNESDEDDDVLDPDSLTYTSLADAGAVMDRFFRELFFRELIRSTGCAEQVARDLTERLALDVGTDSENLLLRTRSEGGTKWGSLTEEFLEQVAGDAAAEVQEYSAFYCPPGT